MAFCQQPVSLYSAVADALLGRLVWGRFAVERPLRVLVFQAEMPLAEDVRRIRKLCLGDGDDTAAILAASKDGRLTWLSQPNLDLTLPQDIARFHAAVRAASSDLVLVDSAAASFASEDLYNVSAVRRCIARALNPIAAEGRAVVLVHHFRKNRGDGPQDNAKDRVAGSMQFVAAAGRVLAVERVSLRPSTETPGPAPIRCVVSPIGAWTPEGEDFYIEIRDTPDGTGTTVRYIPSDSPQAARDLPAWHRVALNVKNRVQRNGSVLLKTAESGAIRELGVGRTAVKDGIRYGEGEGWFHRVPVEGSRTNEKVLLPGPTQDDDPEAQE